MDHFCENMQLRKRANETFLTISDTHCQCNLREQSHVLEHGDSVADDCQTVEQASSDVAQPWPGQQTLRRGHAPRQGGHPQHCDHQYGLNTTTEVMETFSK